MRVLLTLPALAIALGMGAQQPLSQRDYFDNAAKSYLDGKKKEAIQTLESGLKAYPNDPAMEKLAEALLTEMEQQQQNQQEQQQQQQDRQEQQENKNGNDTGGSSDQESQKEENSSKEHQGDPDRDPEDGENSGNGNEESDSPSDDPSNPERNAGDDGQPRKPGTEGNNASNSEEEQTGKQYSLKEAERMLEALNAKDKATKQRVVRAQRGRKNRISKSEKDW